MDKTPISIALERQIPEFIREEYATFVEFVKAYYAFLDKTQRRNLEDIRSIENTLDEFVIRFKKELSVIFPTNSLENERFVLQRIKEFYKTRGSRESFQFLFRALFNKEAEIYYPSKQILRASDGSWIQEKSLFVQATNGNLFKLGGQIISINTDSKSINIFAPRVVYYREDIYEVFIERSYYQDISIGNTVSSTDGSISGVIIACPAKYSIVTGGIGFEIGALYHLPTENGNGSLVKITRIDSVGAIKKIQVISFGLDYPSVFFAKLSNTSRQAVAYYNPITSFTLGSGHPSGLTPTQSFSNTKTVSNQDGSYSSVPAAYNDSTNGYLDIGYISKQTYFAYDLAYTPTVSANQNVFYADGTYVGEIVGSFYTNSSNASVVDGSIAEIKIELGPVAIYPGYYSKSDGFISDEIYIQDGKYYQLFSYVIKVEQQIDTYRDIIKALLHPAGFEMFAEYNIKNTYLLSASALNAFIRRQFTEQEFITDDDATNSVLKISADSNSVFHNVNLEIKDIIKRLAELPLPQETHRYHLDKGNSSQPIENSISSAYGRFDTIADFKFVTKRLQGIEGELQSIISNFTTGADFKIVTKRLQDLNGELQTVLSDFNTNIDTKFVTKRLENADGEFQSIISDFNTVNDFKIVTKRLQGIEGELQTVLSNFTTTADTKFVTKRLQDLQGELQTVLSNFTTTADTKFVTKRLENADGEFQTIVSNFTTTADTKFVTKRLENANGEFTGYTIDLIGDRNGAGKGFVTYVRNPQIPNFDGSFPFATLQSTSETIGDRNGAGKGFVTYVRNPQIPNFDGSFPFATPAPVGEQYRYLFTPQTKTDTYTCVPGGWAWNGSSYILNTPEVIIAAAYFRAPDLGPFTATLTAGSNVVNLTSGNTHGIFPSSRLTLEVISGSGAFGSGARTETVVSSTQFITSTNHTSSGSVTFKTVANTPQLAGTVSTVDSFPNGSIQNLVKFAFSGGTFNKTVSSAELYSPIRTYNRSFVELINNTNTGILYVNAYNQDSADPASTYSYESEIYSVHDTRAIS